MKYQETERSGERLIGFKELAPVTMGLASLKYVRHASRLETQVRVGVTVLKKIAFFFRLLRPSTD